MVGYDFNKGLDYDMSKEDIFNAIREETARVIYISLPNKEITLNDQRLKIKRCISYVVNIGRERGKKYKESKLRCIREMVNYVYDYLKFTSYECSNGDIKVIANVSYIHNGAVKTIYPECRFTKTFYNYSILNGGNAINGYTSKAFIDLLYRSVIVRKVVQEIGINTQLIHLYLVMDFVTEVIDAR